MPTTYYFTVDGEITGQETGGSYTDYLTDALGSVTATVNSSPAVVNTYRHKPYGAQLAKTGAGADPIFRWNGSWGYVSTGRMQAGQYVRARHYGDEPGRWTTVDPLWPEEPQFVYTLARPTSIIDFSGMQGVIIAEPLPFYVPEAVKLVVEQGGKGASRWIPKCTTDPTPLAYPESEIGRESAIRKWESDVDKYCDDLYDWYKRYCGGRQTSFLNPINIGVEIGRPKSCHAKESLSVNRSRAVAQCACCRGRTLHEAHCSYTYPNLKDLEGHVKAKKSACRKCDACKEILKNLGNPFYAKPTPPTYPAAPPWLFVG